MATSKRYTVARQGNRGAVVTTMWAARYALEAPERGARSFVGWSAACSTPEQAWWEWLEYAEPDRLFRLAERVGDDEALARLRAEWEDRGYGVARVPGTDGWLVTLPGVSAFVADTPEEAVALARADERFEGMPLWVFPARVLEEDQDAAVYGHQAGLAVVEVLGPAQRVE